MVVLRFLGVSESPDAPLLVFVVVTAYHRLHRSNRMPALRGLQDRLCRLPGTTVP
jgi:hypothetical protein